MKSVVARYCRRRHLGGNDASGAHQVIHVAVELQEIVGDDAAMAAPPNSLRAHDGSIPGLGDLKHLLEADAILVGQRLVGVVMEAPVAPEGVGCGRDDLGCRTPTTKLGDA